MASKVEFKRIDHDMDQLNIFADTAASYGGFRIPIEYNKASQTWALYIDGVMRGGFVLASGVTMRVPLIAPESVLQSSQYLAQFKQSEWCEVNQVWLADEIKSFMISLRMWLQIRKRILRSGYSIVLIPWQLRNKGIDRFYRKFVSHVLYEGVPRGKAGHDLQVAVGIADMSDIAFGTMKHLPSLLKKILTNRTRAPKLSVDSKKAS